MDKQLVNYTLQSYYLILLDSCLSEHACSLSLLICSNGIHGEQKTRLLDSSDELGYYNSLLSSGKRIKIKRLLLHRNDRN